MSHSRRPHFTPKVVLEVARSIQNQTPVNIGVQPQGGARQHVPQGVVLDLSPGPCVPHIPPPEQEEDHQGTLPRVLEPDRRPKPRTKQPFRASVRGSESNAQALARAREAAIQADAQKRRQRLEAFGAKMVELEAELVQIRITAPTADVHEQISMFMYKVGEAVNIHPDRCTQDGVLLCLGTNRDELDRLQWQVYLEMSIEPGLSCMHVSNELDDDVQQTYEAGVTATKFSIRPPRVRTPITLTTVQLYEGVPRPQAWTSKGGGVTVLVTSVVEVVRAKNSLPTPNRPIPDDPEALARITYPNGGLYGPDHQIQRPSLDGDIESVCTGAVAEFLQWFYDISDLIPQIREENEGTLDHADLVSTFFHLLRQEWEGPMNA